jgi:hypothetical protein
LLQSVYLSVANSHHHCKTDVITDNIIETLPHLWYYELTGFGGKRYYLLMHRRFREGEYAEENT